MEGLLSNLIILLNLTYQIQEDKIKALSQKDIFIEVPFPGRVEENADMLLPCWTILVGMTYSVKFQFTQLATSYVEKISDVAS